MLSPRASGRRTVSRQDRRAPRLLPTTGSPSTASGSSSSGPCAWHRAKGVPSRQHHMLPLYLLVTCTRSLNRRGDAQGLSPCPTLPTHELDKIVWICRTWNAAPYAIYALMPGFSRLALHATYRSARPPSSHAAHLERAPPLWRPVPALHRKRAAAALQQADAVGPSLRRCQRRCQAVFGVLTLLRPKQQRLFAQLFIALCTRVLLCR